MIIFFLGNYVAHAATVVAKPGQSALASLISIITALLFPGGGIRSGVDAIMSLAKLGKTNLQTAARAGAICAVVIADLELDGTPGVRGQGGPTTASEAKDAFEPREEGAVEPGALRAKRGLSLPVLFFSPRALFSLISMNVRPRMDPRDPHPRTLPAPRRLRPRRRPRSCDL